MVEASLGQACRDIEAGIRSKLGELDVRIPVTSADERDGLTQQRASVTGSFAERVLGLRVLDPAMGSGHFLIRACQYLSEEIATNPYTSEPEAEDANESEASILEWKRRVAETCLYGVDVNPMAVELAKLALWLETVAIDAPLAFLDHHLRPGDSLIGARIEWLDSLPGKTLITGFFKDEIAAAVPSLLEPLAEIRELPSSTLENVKRKEQLFKRRFRTAQQRFERVADVWCASAIGVLPDLITPRDFASVVQTLATQRRNGGQVGQALIETAQARLNDLQIHCFHWELAFPEVFLDSKRLPGFDVVIGNPPYDVLAEKEAGPRIAYLKAFISHDPGLKPSIVGKNNLYKLFICRAVELGREGGYVSFIVPMPLLGDEQARGIREALLRDGVFRQIHSFPQKDNPQRRVFRDAKLSTSLFVFQKGAVKKGESPPFLSIRHQANIIDVGSPSLTVRTTEIPLYDPGNLTIVSCAQDDWDLAVRVVQRPGIRRLGTVCKSYQGEVNEKTDSTYINRRQTDGRPLILRGSNVCMYVLRQASQGVPLYLDAAAYQKAKATSEKAFHTRVDRIGFQRSAPQNNFRRVIAAYVPAGEFCFDTVSYIPRGPRTLIDLDLLLVILNSKLADWYFTIGSTNSKVNEYQFNNLPCPVFRKDITANEKIVWRDLTEQIGSNPASVVSTIGGLLEETPFSPVLEQLLITLSRRIRSEEESRAEISRAARAHLAPTAQIFQDLVDTILFRMVGFGERDVEGLLSRSAQMS